MKSGNYSYNSGERLFRRGEEIFMNRCTEKKSEHLHAHDFIELAYITSGKGIHRIGSREYRVGKGDLFVINYDVPHEFRSVPSLDSGGLHVCNCVFRPQFLDRSLVHSRCFSDLYHIFLFSSLGEEGADNDLHLIGRDTREIGWLYDRMYQEYTGRPYGYLDMLRACLVQLLILILRAWHGGENEERHLRGKRYFEKAIRFMQQHYQEDIKLEDLAAMSFLSTSYFCISFKKCTGMTVLKYIQQLRIEEACDLLRSTDRKVVDIAQAVGYSDLKFFNRLFKSVTGLTPSAWRSMAPSEKESPLPAAGRQF